MRYTLLAITTCCLLGAVSYQNALVAMVNTHGRLVKAMLRDPVKRRGLNDTSITLLAREMQRELDRGVMTRKETIDTCAQAITAKVLMLVYDNNKRRPK